MTEVREEEGLIHRGGSTGMTDREIRRWKGKEFWVVDTEASRKWSIANRLTGRFGGRKARHLL